MNYKKTIFFLIFFGSFFGKIIAQQTRKDSLLQQLHSLKKQEIALREKIGEIELDTLHKYLIQYGLPNVKPQETVVNHRIISLSYNEKHKQANWVAHIISPEITRPGFARTNDFRKDPKLKTETAGEKDYFLKSLQDDGSYTYKNFGYDRGHLAPSADFRWNKKAMSQSYYYSNISPQLPDFNRGVWASLESFIREYVQEHEQKVYVVTGPVLTDNLPVIERSRHKVSIPEFFFKVVLNTEGDTARGIGFILPHSDDEYPPISYATTIDEVEKLTGIDFFPALPDSLEEKVERTLNIKHWQTQSRKRNVAPISRRKLPKNAYNTVQARSHFDSKEKICGTVVEIHKTRSGNYFLNFDQDFPEQLFWCTIWKDNLVNFSYNPVNYLINKKICVKGNIKKKYGKPSMNLYNEKAITLYEDEMLKNPPKKM